jgi:hypothetical protein
MILMAAETATRFRIHLDPNHTPRIGIRTTHTAEEIYIRFTARD